MVNKKIVLNVCGVKSLGGLKLFLESFDFLAESGSKLKKYISLGMAQRIPIRIENSRTNN